MSALILDTLEHVITATYLDYPPVSVRYKGVNDTMPVSVWSGNRGIFSSDSIHMSIISVFPATFVDSPAIPILSGDSARENAAIMTFDNPGDTSITVALFSSYRSDKDGLGFVTATYAPLLKSYSALFPLSFILNTQVAKRRNSGYEIFDMTYDTVYAVFKKDSDYDTFKVSLPIPTYIASTGIGNPCRGEFNPYQGFATSNRNGVKIYDIKGRLTGSYPARGMTSNANILSNGVYLLQSKNGESGVLRKGVVIR